jgi:hypothetical protein
MVVGIDVGATGLRPSFGSIPMYQMSLFSRVIATSVSYVAIIENLYHSLRKLFLGNPTKNTDFFARRLAVYLADDSW